MAKVSNSHTTALSTMGMYGSAILTFVIRLTEGATELQNMKAPKEPAKPRVNIGDGLLSSKGKAH